MEKKELEKDNKHISVLKVYTDKFLDILKNNYIPIIAGFLIFQVNFFISLMIFKKSFWLLHVIAFIIPALMFIFIKDMVDEKKKKLSYTLIKFSIYTFFMAITNHIVITGIISIKFMALANKLMSLIYFLDIVLAVALAILFRHPEVLSFLDELYSTNIIDLILKKDEEVKPGDAVLGKDTKTEKPVILPANDRFLHMLILGPTGCGKTSQSIIPMINRDMNCRDTGITVIEPKGDLAEKIYAMAKYYDRNVLYFNPVMPDCPYFNPLHGKESDVVENMATTFRMLNPDSPTFFLDQAENLIRKSIKLLKRLYGDDANLIHLNNLIWNTNKAGIKIVNEFSKLPSDNKILAQENKEIAEWFSNDYFTGTTGDRGATKSYEHCSGVRTQVAKLVSNEYLRKVLNPPPGVGSDIDFDKALANGDVIAIATAQGTLRDLGRYLGYFIILQLQSAVFRRPGNEFTRRHNMLYIDEFQVYANPGFADMLTQGRSYRVASHLATQNRALIGMGGGKDGKNFVELVSTNARNLILYPGGNATDAKYYSEQLGEVLERSEQRSYSKQRFTIGGSSKPVTDSVRIDEKYVKRFSPSDIIYQKFGIITYCITKNKSIQFPSTSKIEYIPKELNEKLDSMVAEYNEEQAKKSANPSDLISELKRNKATTDLKNSIDYAMEKVVVKEYKDPLNELEIEERAMNGNMFNENAKYVDEGNEVKTESRHVIGDSVLNDDIEEEDDDIM